jgi:hypothetical protein
LLLSGCRGVACACKRRDMRTSGSDHHRTHGMAGMCRPASAWRACSGCHSESCAGMPLTGYSGFLRELLRWGLLPVLILQPGGTPGSVCKTLPGATHPEDSSHRPLTGPAHARPGRRPSVP